MYNHISRCFGSVTRRIAPISSYNKTFMTSISQHSLQVPAIRPHNIPTIFKGALKPTTVLCTSAKIASVYISTRDASTSDKPKDKSRSNYNKNATYEMLRANRAIWANKRKTGHRAQVMREFQNNENIYQANEFNDYITELAKTRIQASKDRDEKRWEGISDREQEEDDPFFAEDYRLEDKLSRQIASAKSKEEIDTVKSEYYEKRAQRTAANFGTVTLMLVIFMAAGMDSINPDSFL